MKYPGRKPDGSIQLILKIDFEPERLMDIPVYVISLRSSAGRKKDITDSLNNSGILHTVVEAVNGSELSDKEVMSISSGIFKQGFYSRNLLKGEIGCVLSHFSLYRKMIDEDIEIACILEDDAVIAGNFRDFLDSENVNMNGWDILYLGHHSLFSKEETSSINKQRLKIPAYTIGEPVEIPVGSYGYMIRRNAAALILERGYPVRKPLDFYIGNASALEIKVKIISPPCINHNYLLLSTIYNEKEIVFADTFIESIRKMVRKSYRWFPGLRTFRIRVAVTMNDSAIILRKKGLIRRSYAKFD